MNKNFGRLFMTFFLIWTIIRVQYVSIPVNDEKCTQKIQIFFEEDCQRKVMRVYPSQIKQEIIPLGRVRVIIIPRTATTNFYIFNKILEEK